MTNENVYRDREIDPSALEQAIALCAESIRLAPDASRAWREDQRYALPSHAAYRHLAIIRLKQGDLKNAIDLCKQAR